MLSNYRGKAEWERTEPTALRVVMPSRVFTALVIEGHKVETFAFAERSFPCFIGSVRAGSLHTDLLKVGSISCHRRFPVAVAVDEPSHMWPDAT